jgi:hypothetical protein
MSEIDDETTETEVRPAESGMAPTDTSPTNGFTTRSSFYLCWTLKMQNVQPLSYLCTSC